MPYLRKLGSAIKEERNKRYLTQEKLAELANMNSTHLGHIEQGIREPRIKTLIKIADALRVRVKDLIPF
jgi:transcriptional regulator with XRE-family HTH domain